MLTVADRGEGGDKICQNLADVICERSLRYVNCMFMSIKGPEGAFVKISLKSAF